MKKFGINVETSLNGQFFNYLTNDIKDLKESNPGETISEEYKPPVEYDYKSHTFRVPGDFSTAALLMSAGIVSEGELVIKNLDFTMPQGDMEIINIIKEMGGKIEVDKNKGIS